MASCTRHEIKKQFYTLADNIRTIADNYAEGKPVSRSDVAHANLTLKTLSNVVTGDWDKELAAHKLDGSFPKRM